MKRTISITAVVATVAMICLWMTRFSGPFNDGRQNASAGTSNGTTRENLPLMQSQSPTTPRVSESQQGSDAIGGGKPIKTPSATPGENVLGLGPKNQLAQQVQEQRKTSETANSESRAVSPDVSALLDAARRENRLAEFGGELAMDGSRPKVMILLEAIEMTSGREREELARSLQGLSSPEAAVELQQFIVKNSKDSTVAVQARNALARVATETDLRRITETIPSDPQEGLARSYLLGTLARVSNPDTVSALAGFCLRDENHALYTSAAIALGGIGTPEAVNALVDVIQQRNIANINDPVSQALMTVANKDSVTVLRERFASSTNPVIQYATAHALTVLSNQSGGQK